MRAHLDDHVTTSFQTSEKRYSVSKKKNILKAGPNDAEDSADGVATKDKSHGITISEEQLVSSLIELFREIDVNGDGSMEWHELSRYISGKAFVSHDKEARRQVGKDFYPVSSIHGRTHNNIIEKIINMPARDEIAVLVRKYFH
jgi:hypothetical protein